MSQYLSVAEDIEWLRDEWWRGPVAGVPDGHLRRGSTTLRLLLVDQLALKAWRYYGFSGQPLIHGPDLEALAAREGVPIRNIVALIAGGGRIAGGDLAMLGFFRADNPQTGAKALDPVGFAVEVMSILRKPGQCAAPGELSALVERPWSVNAYVDAPGAVSNGAVFSRRDIIQYFANLRGVHISTRRIPQGDPSAKDLS